MIKFLDCQDKNQVKNIFLVHGDIDAQHAFSDRLREVGYQNIEIPAFWFFCDKERKSIQINNWCLNAHPEQRSN